MYFGPIPLLMIYLGYVSVVPVMVGSLISFYQFFKTKERFIIFQGMGYMLWAFFLFFTAFSFQFKSISSLQTAFSLLVVAEFCAILFVDSISRESFDIRKFVILTFVSGVFLVLIFTPNSLIFVNSGLGEQFLNASDLTFLALFILLMIGTCILFYFTAMLVRKAPKSLRFYIIIAFIGNLIGVVIAPISLGAGLDKIFPGISFILVGFGQLVVAIPFAAQPKICYVLPFKASSLTIVETTGGIPIFSYKWVKKEEMDDGLFSGIIHAITQILNESVNAGNINEIYMDEAILIVRRSRKYPIACILVSTRSSKFLRQALKSFADRFFKDFAPNFANPNEMEQFRPASNLVGEYFPFIPEYD
jgi:hypothetical protein